jgi:hypothetical protein
MNLVELAKGCVSMHLYGDWRGRSSHDHLPVGLQPLLKCILKSIWYTGIGLINDVRALLKVL